MPFPLIVNGFNSMIVRLKDNKGRKAAQFASGFNSMIVRLKDRTIVAVHCGGQFQFYDSPIKRKLIPHNGRAFGGFNSMIVRLKGLHKQVVLGLSGVSIL